MDYSVSFGRHFARLVWLILHEPSNIEEQKAALRALVTISRDGAVRFARSEQSVSINGNALPSILAGVPDLVARMFDHGHGEIVFAQGATPAEILGAARGLAGAPNCHPEPQAKDLAPAREGQIPRSARDDTSVPDQRPRVTMAFEALGMVPPEEHHHDARLSATVSGLVADGGGDMFMQFAGAMPSASPEELLRRLDAAHDADARGRALEEIAIAAEQASRDARPAVAGELLYGLVDREARASADAKRSVSLTILRLAKGPMLRGVAALLPRKPESRERFTAVLMRAGEDGADALVDQLTHAQTSDDRRVYFDVLLKLNAGVSTLVHMLGDARWFVARNAAELLGEMGAHDAEGPLAQLLTHGDERVRRAATDSLLRFNTPTSIAAVERVAESGAPTVRVGAIAALGARRDGNTATTLVRALDAEQDEEVQVALIGALGKVGTPDAIERLLKVAEAEGRFFRKKSSYLRAAAVLALGEARQVEAVRGYLEDREKEVRDAALRALANARKSAALSAIT